MIENIVNVPIDWLTWSFHSPGGQCHVRLGQGKWGRQTFVDPFPGYAHAEALATAEVRYCDRVFPVDLPVRLYLLPFEELGRSNGWTQFDHDYSSDGKSSKPLPSIVLSGKRIPIHPAMTRYLVAHEYGHVVQRWWEHHQGIKDGDTAFLQEYAGRRGLGWQGDDASGGRWHTSPGEIFANDFRMLVAGREPEFWPHPDAERPERITAIVEWWRTAIAVAEELESERQGVPA